MSALGWKVGDPHAVADQLAFELPDTEAREDPEPEIDDGLSWDEWIRGLPPIR